MNKLLTFIFAILFAMPCFATGVSGNSGTCDSGALGTDGSSTILRANYEPETIHLRWYDENNNLLTVNSASQSCTYGDSITIPTAPSKTGYRFTGWSVFSDYTPIEYLESDKRYIDTGFKFTGNIVTYNLIYSPLDNDLHAVLFGACDNDTNWSGMPYRDTTGYINLYIGTSKKLQALPEAINTVYNYSLTIDRINSTWEIQRDGNTYSGIYSGTPTDNTNITLFANNDGTNNGGTSYKQRSYYRIYSFKVTQDGVLIRDMIPVKDINNVVCMYDKVSGQFFYTGTSGTLIAGPEI